MNTYLNGLFDLAIDKGMAFGRCLGVHISRPCMDIDTVFMLMRPLLGNPNLVLLRLQLLSIIRASWKL